MHVPTS